MNNITEKVCRLCFKTLYHNNFDTIEEVTKQMLDVLFLKLNFQISKNPVMCNECATTLQQSFDFKSACLCLEKNPSNKEIKANLKEMCVKEGGKMEQTDSLENEKVCRFCKKLVENGCFTLLQETKENMFLVDMLPKHIPELNLNITEELVSCYTCLKSLQRLFGFIMKCLDVEEKMKSFVETDGAEDKLRINLNNTQEFDFKPMLHGNDDTNEDVAVKAEFKTENFMSDANVGVNVKIEEVNVKMEQGECESFQEVAPLPPPVSKNIHKCKLCNFESKYKSSLTRHMIVHINPSEYNNMHHCKMCSFQTKYKISLTQHMLMHKEPSEITAYKCELCTYEAIHKKYLKRHMLTHTDSSDITMHECPMCSFVSKRKDSLNEHKLTHKNSLEVAIYKCELCPYETKLRRNVNRHMEKHRKSEIEATIYKCGTCSFETKYKNSLSTHMLVHKNPTDVTTYKCEVCPYETKYKNKIKTHAHIRKTSRSAKHKCGTCAYETKHKYHLKTHLLTHKSASEVPMYKCDVCSYETRHKMYFKRHIVSHQNSSLTRKSLSESATFKSDEEKYKFKKHLCRSSSSETRIYTCVTCSYETNHKYNLNDHMLTHKSPS